MNTVPTIIELKKFEKTDAQGPILRACDFVAVYVGKVFLYLPFTPNQITFIWIFMKIIGALFLATGNYGVSIAGVLLFHLGSIVDGADGIVARARQHFSLNGVYLDYAGHYLTNSFILITLAWGVYATKGDISVFIPAAISIYAFLLSKVSTINPMWYSNKDQRLQVEEIIYKRNIALKKQKNKLLALVFDVIRLENPFNLLFWGILFGYPLLTLWLYAASSCIEMLRRLFIQFYRISKAER